MRYQRLSSVLFPVTGLLFLGSIYWGYQQHEQKNAITVKAENQYQRAFHDLSYHMDQLHHQLGNTLAVHSNSLDYHRKGLVNVWRLTGQAQNEIHQLPLTMLPFSDTQNFLSKVSSFAYNTSVRDLGKEPLNDKEFETMKTLYAKSAELSNDLQSMQQKVLSNNLRWVDVDHVMAARKAANRNDIIDGFQTVNKKVKEYPEINWGPSMAAMNQKHTLKMLSGNTVTAKDIKEKAVKFLGVPANSDIKVVENGKGTEYASYSASLMHAKSGNNISMDFTQHGGELLSYMHPRDVTVKSISMEQARASGDKFLTRHGYKDMTPVRYDEFGNKGVFSYVSTRDGALVYPEMLTVKVALDNGEVIGLHASDYVLEHHSKRTVKKPGLSEQMAAKSINPAMKSQPAHLAVIKNENGADALCYEYAGKMNGAFYRIYINADTGSEEAVEELPAMTLVPSK